LERLYPLLHVLQSPSESHEVQPVDEPLPQLQHLYPLQLLLAQWLLEEQEYPSLFFAGGGGGGGDVLPLQSLPHELHEW
jgi:hypothetical protein